MNRFVKGVMMTIGGIAGLGVITVVGLAGLGFYMRSMGYVPSRAAAHHQTGSGVATASASHAVRASNPAAADDATDAPTNKFVAKLESLARAGRYSDIGAAIANGAEELTPEDRDAAIAWLEQRVRWGRNPTLFHLARLYEASGDMPRAAEYFSAASVAYTIDAECVIDRSARQAVMRIQEHMPKVLDHIENTPGEAARVLRWGLDYEEKIKDREPAHWIAAHGMNGKIDLVVNALREQEGLPPVDADPKPAEDPFVSVEARERIRQKLRATYEQTAAAPAAKKGAAGGGAGASPVVARIEALEHSREYGELGAMIINDAGKMSAADRAALIAWLEPRQRWGRVPVLFLLSRLYEAQGEMARAAEYYAAAGIAYRIDAKCIADKTAHGAVGIIEMHLPKVREHLANNPREIVRSLRWGLEYEERLKDREPAYWIAAHGLGSMRDMAVEHLKDQGDAVAGQKAPDTEGPAVSIALVSDDEQARTREEVRRSFEEIIAKYEKK